MIGYYKQKVFILLVILILILSGIFILALTNPSFNFIDIGLANETENVIIAFFSFLCLCLVVYDLIKI